MSPRAWLAIVLATAIAMAGLAGQPQEASAQEDPAEPTGRAVCNIAFTAAAAVSFGSYSVPPEVPLGPNDVVVALTPILQACSDMYEPAPQRRCFTSDLNPNTGVPISPPDPVGIATEQAEVVVSAATEPLNLALRGALRDLFASALECRDPTGAPDRDDDYTLAPLPPPASPPPSMVLTTTPAPPATPGVRSNAAVTRGPAPAAPAEQRPSAGSRASVEPFSSLISAVPDPLRGPAVAFSVVVLAGLIVVFRRQLTPRRCPSLLDAGAKGGR